MSAGVSGGTSQGYEGKCDAHITMSPDEYKDSGMWNTEEWYRQRTVYDLRASRELRTKTATVVAVDDKQIDALAKLSNKTNEIKRMTVEKAGPLWQALQKELQILDPQGKYDTVDDVHKALYKVTGAEVTKVIECEHQKFLHMHNGFNLITTDYGAKTVGFKTVFHGSTFDSINDIKKNGFKPDALTIHGKKMGGLYYVTERFLSALAYSKPVLEVDENGPHRLLQRALVMVANVGHGEVPEVSGQGVFPTGVHCVTNAPGLLRHERRTVYALTDMYAVKIIGIIEVSTDLIAPCGTMFNNLDANKIEVMTKHAKSLFNPFVYNVLCLGELTFLDKLHAQYRPDFKGPDSSPRSPRSRTLEGGKDVGHPISVSRKDDISIGTTVALCKLLPEFRSVNGHKGSVMFIIQDDDTWWFYVRPALRSDQLRVVLLNNKNPAVAGYEDLVEGDDLVKCQRHNLIVLSPAASSGGGASSAGGASSGGGASSAGGASSGGGASSKGAPSSGGAPSSAPAPMIVGIIGGSAFPLGNKRANPASGGASGPASIWGPPAKHARLDDVICYRSYYGYHESDTVVFKDNVFNSELAGLHGKQGTIKAILKSGPGTASSVYFFVKPENEDAQKLVSKYFDKKFREGSFSRWVMETTWQAVHLRDFKKTR